MGEADFRAIALGLAVALAATALALLPGLAAALVLARSRSRWTALLELLVDLPLVLPPTAVGYLLLVSLARRGPLAQLVGGGDLGVLFTWKAAVLASAAMALPLVVRAARVAFEAIDPRLELLARTSGLTRVQVLARVTLPLARRGLVAAVVLGFGRALAEFGATVIAAGNIPGRTQTLSLAIYEAILLGEDRRALGLVAVSIAFSAAAIATARILVRPRKEPTP